MATTKISDIIEPAVYANYMQLDDPEKNRFVRAGIMAAPPENIVSQVNAGGRTIDMPHWDDLVRGFPDIVTDDETTDATLDKVNTTGDKAVKHYWHKGWSNMDITGIIATGDRRDPAEVVLNKFLEWWIGAEQRALLSSCAGVIADNKANFSSDMVYSIYSDVASPTAANKISQAAVDRARLTSGDSLDDYVAIAMHSTVYGNLLDNDAITFIQESTLPGKIPMYGPQMVIVDDQMPVTTGTNSDMYTCYLFGRGAIGYQAQSLDPGYSLEFFRKPEAGNGGGEDRIHTRRNIIMHPRGVAFDGTPASTSPTQAELATGGNWTRVFERKLVKLAALEVNAG